MTGIARPQGVPFSGPAIMRSINGEGFDRQPASPVSVVTSIVGANGENMVPGAWLTTWGPHGPGTARLRMSIDANGCVKSDTRMRFYRTDFRGNNTLLHDQTSGSQGDNTGGLVFDSGTVNIPAWHWPVTYTWNWRSDCSNSAWRLYSKHQRIWVPPRPTPQYGLPVVW